MSGRICPHCAGSGWETYIDTTDPSGVWHEVEQPCRRCAVPTPAWAVWLAWACIALPLLAVLWQGL